ncbi:MAG: hypothetical protein RL748_1588 [Pseudomonadota bacterium]|jgi:hypothetical protein
MLPSYEELGNICYQWFSIEDLMCSNIEGNSSNASSGHFNDSDIISIIDGLKFDDATERHRGAIHKFRKARNKIVHKGEMPKDFNKLCNSGELCIQILRKNFCATKIINVNNSIIDFGIVAREWLDLELKIKDLTKEYPDEENSQIEIKFRIDVLPEFIDGKIRDELHLLREIRNKVLHNDEKINDVQDFLLRARMCAIKLENSKSREAEKALQIAALINKVYVDWLTNDNVLKGLHYAVLLFRIRSYDYVWIKIPPATRLRSWVDQTADVAYPNLLKFLPDKFFQSFQVISNERKSFLNNPTLDFEYEKWSAKLYFFLRDVNAWSSVQQYPLSKE